MGSRLTLREIESITEDFYSCFCGVKLSDMKRGIYFVPSEQRDLTLAGLGGKYSVYILSKNDLCAVSYSLRYKDYFDGLKDCSIDKIISQANRRFNLKKMKLLIFNGETVFDYGGARILQPSDYPLYEAFFRTAYPGTDTAGWLNDYFIEKTEKRYFTGYFSENKLVSVSDAPDMPYMQDLIQHTGIMTLKEERKKGYARCTAALSAHNLIERGVCPQYECEADNTASFALAVSVGYKEYGTAYILKE